MPCGVREQGGGVVKTGKQTDRRTFVKVNRECIYLLRRKRSRLLIKFERTNYNKEKRYKFLRDQFVEYFLNERGPQKVHGTVGV